MAAGKLRHPSIPCRTAFRVAVQHEDRARFAPRVGEVVDHIVKIEIWWNVQCGHSACPFRCSDDRCARTLPPSCAQVHLRSMWVPPGHCRTIRQNCKLGRSTRVRTSVMSNRPEERLDRRDFMIASMATAGASAALAISAGVANAQGAAATSADPASGTVYTGDTIQGKKVVSALDVNHLEPGKKHFLYFQGVQMPTGHHCYVSVTVAKGAKPGKRVILVSGVHGDEMSSVHTVQTVMSQLDANEMSGTVMAVMDVSRPAMEGMQPRWPNQGRGIDLIDMNREWPGNENGATAPSRHAGLLFNRLLRPNADFAIDFHTGTTGFEVTAFNIGGMDVPEVKAMMELYPVGQIFDNHVYPGVLHNAFMDVGIPSFTPEIGAARVLDHEMISLFVEGTMNVLKHHGIVAGPMGRTGTDVT